jgi:hypothetical protein
MRPNESVKDFFEKFNFSQCPKNMIFFQSYLLEMDIHLQKMKYTFSVRESDKSDTFIQAIFSSSNIDQKLPLLYYILVSKVKMQIKNY